MTGNTDIRKLRLVPAHCRSLTRKHSRNNTGTVADQVILIPAKKCRKHVNNEICDRVTWVFVVFVSNGQYIGGIATALY